MTPDQVKLVQDSFAKVAPISAWNKPPEVVAGRRGDREDENEGEEEDFNLQLET